MVISEFLEDVKSTSDEKKAPPYMERLQKEHCSLKKYLDDICPLKGASEKTLFFTFFLGTS